MKLYSLFFTLLFLWLHKPCFSLVKTITLYPENGKDFTEQVRNIIAAHPGGDFTLKFKKGLYDFYPEKAIGKYLSVSNNDNGYKHIVFNLSNTQNVIIEGEDAEFLMHGTLVPFLISGSNNTLISGISIDYDYGFVLEGEVVAQNASEKSIDLEITSGNPVYVKDEQLYFKGYNWECLLGENMVFDKQNKRPYYNAARYLHHSWKNSLKAKQLSEKIFRLYGFNSDALPPLGAVYTDKGLQSLNRLYPGIVLQASFNTSLINVKVYMAGAMALIAENCENVNLKAFDVKIREGSTRVVSSSADATHFVACRGKISFEDCTFSNMLDDATNVHGVYMEGVEKIDDRTLGLKFGHAQQQGFDFAKATDEIVVVDRNTLLPVFSSRVRKLTKVNDNYYLLEITDVLPDLDPKGIAVENKSSNATVVMKDCRVYGNRARSILLSTSKPVLIENNYFSSMMAGILIAGDGNKWWESGSVDAVVIRRNTFENLGTGGGEPQSVLQISPEIHKRISNRYYHGKVVFEGNIVRTFDSQVIYALSVRDISIRNNKFEVSRDFKPIFKGLAYFDFQNCKRIVVTENTYDAEPQVQVSVKDCEETIYHKNKGFSKSIINNPNAFFYQQ
ncbi:Right handed beta helix region [Pedobacter sp. ok626]|uniref:right-handed parallel beta-helix repeat-containing protein n=1 Tax=Pedobacter sp. ok626 TaxID=1761882 RepID=UPI00088269F6|nr:right-handed parallel beta-helix repeat-containing protein [Pedobacter sp. ok626]SDK56197.1 Right handed beta helix region [Pedobacter sp. ok626]